MLHTTFALAHKGGACKPSYRAVAEALGGVRTYGRNTPIPLTRILGVGGIDDAMWCLAHVLPEEAEKRDRLARLLACDYAEHVAGFWVAPPGVTWKPSDAIAVSRRFALGQASDTELAKAEDAAWAAARAVVTTTGPVAWAARGAAWAAGDAAEGDSWFAAAAAAEAAADAAGATSGDAQAAEAEERRWQAELLFAYLVKEGE